MAKRLKGLWKDSEPVDQPEGTYTNALNALLTKKYGSICNEDGNTQIDNIPSGYEIIGSTLIYNNQTVLFMASDDNSRIYTFTDDGLNLVIENNNLNFSKSSNIEAVNVINNKEEVVVYWTDGVNPPRYINITNPQELSSVEDLNVFPILNNIAKINLEEVRPTGGSLQTGSYYFGVRFIDEDNTYTGFTSISQPVYLNDDSNVFDKQVYDGAPAGTPTSKSILINIDNLDESYSRYQICVIRKENNTVAETILLPQQNISSSQDVFIYSGNESSLSTSLDEILIDSASYQTAKTIAEIDNILYLGNLKKKPDVQFQKFANNIKISAISKPIGDGVGAGNFKNDGHYGNPLISFYNKSFKRGEVYAFYISFVLKNGTESQAYHIPGREAVNDELDDLTSGDGNSYDISSQSGKRFQFFTDNATSDNNYMGYWENESEPYPALADDENGNWEIWDVDGNGDGFATGNSLHGENVRHHQFPRYEDNNFSVQPYYKDNNAYCLGVQISDIKIPDTIAEQVSAIKIYYAKRTDNNRRILDQALVQPYDVKQPKAEIDDDEQVLRFSPNGPDSSKYLFTRPFHLLRTKKSIGSLTHIELINRPKGETYEYTRPNEDIGDFFEDLSNDIDTRRFYDLTESNESLSGESFYQIEAGAKAYCRENSLVEVKSKGFDYNVDNTRIEESIAIQLTEILDLNPLFYNQENGVDISAGINANLCSYLTDVFVPFDQQELVWTGFIDNNIEKYTSDNFGYSGTEANGTITVNQGSVDVLSSLDNLELNLNGETINVEISSGDNTQRIASAISQSINSQSSNYRSIYSGNQIDIESTSNGTAYNGTISLTVNNTGVTYTDTELSGGTDNSSAGSISEGSIEITSGADAGLVGSEASITNTIPDLTSYNGDSYKIHVSFYNTSLVTSYYLDSSSSAFTVAVAMKQLLESNDTINSTWDITTNDNGDGTADITITAKSIGTQYNDYSLSGYAITSTGRSGPNLSLSGNTSGGQNSDLEDYQITIINTNINVTIGSDPSTSGVASDIVEAINSQTSLYSAVLNSSTVEIDSVNKGTDYNGSISVDANNTTITENITNMSGGSQPVIDGNPSEGSITITNGANTVGGRSTGYINITQDLSSTNIRIRSGDNYTIGVGFYGQNLVSSTISSNISKQSAAIIIESLLSSNSVITDDWIIDTINESGVSKVRIQSKNGGEQWNNYSISVFIKDSNNNNVIYSGILTEPTSGGTVPSIDNLIIYLKNEQFSVNVTESESALSIAGKITTELSNSSIYNVTQNSTNIDIEAKDVGEEFNGGITYQYGNTGILLTDNEITGGRGPVNSGEIFGGDTYIAEYSERSSGENNTTNKDRLHKYLFNYIIESYDNIKLRHALDDGYSVYYPKFTYDRVLDAEERDPNNSFYGNTIEYNPDYSSQADIKTAIPQNSVSEDINTFSTRIIRSAQGDENIISDTGIRTFLANDYMDLTRSRGELIKLSVLQNILIPHMERSLIRTKGREELTTGDFRAYLGAGDIFAARPDELISTKEGFAGLQDSRSAIVTPFGYFFVDRQARKVILVSEGPDIISDKGLSNFFYEQLEDASNGELIVNWDSEYNRIILSRNAPTQENSWTLSYYPELEAWGSFHSYIGEYYFYNINGMYSSFNEEIYKHNDETNPCNFYGNQYDFEYEFIDNRSPKETKQAFNLQFHTEVIDQSDQYFYKETFDKFRVSNNFQDSGEQDIIYFTGANGNARNVEGTWKINKFRDMLVNGSIDLNKPWYNQNRFISKFLRVKLIYSNSNNKFIYLYDTDVGFKKSYR